MTLAHDAYDFESMPHGTIAELEAHDLPIVTGRFFGVEGESHIVGKRQGRTLLCDFTLQGYASTTALQAASDTISSKAGELTGTLTETISGNDRDYEACTFLGFQPKGPPFFDGASSTWVQFGRLVWRQRKP